MKASIDLALLNKQWTLPCSKPLTGGQVLLASSSPSLLQPEQATMQEKLNYFKIIFPYVVHVTVIFCAWKKLSCIIYALDNLWGWDVWHGLEISSISPKSILFVMTHAYKMTVLWQQECNLCSKVNLLKCQLVPIKVQILSVWRG